MASKHTPYILVPFLFILCAFLFAFSSTTAQAQKVHALLVLMGNDSEITTTVKKSQQTMTELMQLVSRNCEVKLTVMKSMPGLEGEVRYKRLANTEVKAQNSPQQLGIIKSKQVMDWVREVRVMSADTLLVYFNGHGEIDTYGNHRLVFDGFSEDYLSRDLLAGALKEKSARLKLLITDTCSYAPGGAKPVQRSPVDFAEIAPKTRFYAKNLFLEHEGFLNITAASPGKLAYGNPDVGGFFTSGIANSLTPASDRSKKDDFLTWSEVFSAAQKETKRLCEQTPDLKDADKVQIPVKHSLPVRAKLVAVSYENMVSIPAGEFQMGSNDGYNNEKPVHTVYVDEFYMDTHEVTNADYKAFVDANPSWQKGGHLAQQYANGDYLKHWNGNAYPQGRGDHPVVWVSWYSAMAYAQWAGKRLPTEAEWEKAARGGLAAKKYPWGDQSLNATRANYGKKWTGKTIRTTRVRNYAPNRYGLYDMAGNVYEWCLDAWEPYAGFASQNPVAGATDIRQITSNFMDYSPATKRVTRGGAWTSQPKGVRAANRGAGSPINTHWGTGFRCVR